MTSTAGLASLGTLVDKFQLDVYKKALQAKGKNLPDSADVKDILVYETDVPPAALLKSLNADLAGRAQGFFTRFLEYQAGKLNPEAEKEFLGKALRDCITKPDLRDELYLLVVKQTRNCPKGKPLVKAWRAFLPPQEVLMVVTATSPPTRDFLSFVSEYIHDSIHENLLEPAAMELAKRTWGYLKRSAKAGTRRVTPTAEELDAIIQNKPLSLVVYFLDDTFEELTYDPSTTIAEAVEKLAGIIQLVNYSTFSLFEQRKYLPTAKAPDGTPIEPEVLPLEDNAYVADICSDFRSLKAENKELAFVRFHFKKKMFRETDDAISEPVFVTLSYLQAQHDYLQGNYPVARDDASQIAALQIHVEAGAALSNQPDAIVALMDRYIPRPLIASRSREDWIADVTQRYRALAAFSKDDARAGVLRIIRALPYGNSIFFPVKRIEDPIGLLPGRILLGINKRGIHFFRPVPKEYLHSAELRDIMQFGSSSQAVFFKMRVAGILHVFQFETRQGEDICVALQTHINDIMMRRYQKQQKAAGAPPAGSTVAAVASPTLLAKDAAADGHNADYAQIYEKHAMEMQQVVSDAQKKLEAAAKEREALLLRCNEVEEKLAEAMDKLALEVSGHLQAQQSNEQLQRELDEANAKLSTRERDWQDRQADAESQIEALQAQVRDLSEQLSAATGKEVPVLAPAAPAARKEPAAQPPAAPKPQAKPAAPPTNENGASDKKAPAAAPAGDQPMGDSASTQSLESLGATAAAAIDTLAASRSASGARHVAVPTVPDAPAPPPPKEDKAAAKEEPAGKDKENKKEDKEDAKPKPPAKPAPPAAAPSRGAKEPVPPKAAPSKGGKAAEAEEESKPKSRIPAPPGSKGAADDAPGSSGDDTREKLANAKAEAAETRSKLQHSTTLVKDLQQQCKDLEAQLQGSQEKARALEKQKAAVVKDKELLSAKLERLEKTTAAERERISSESGKQLEEAKARYAELEHKYSETRKQLEVKEAQEAEMKAHLEKIQEAQAELDELREMKENVERRQKEDADKLEKQARRIRELEKTYKEEVVLRKKYWNMLQDQAGKIRVYARTRPMSEKEKAEKQQSVLTFPDEYSLQIPAKDAADKKPREFQFDYCFDESSTQDKVFDEVRSLIQSSVDGYNVCIFAYGQTGSGKTFTINGPEGNPGIVRRSLEELYKIVDAISGRLTVTVKAYMLELYQDKLIDLLYNAEHPRAERPTLEVKKDPKGWVTVANCTVREVKSFQELNDLQGEGLARRRVAHTQMNTESSRSHLIFSVVIEATDLQTQSVTKGKLSFVDLAGSERLKKSGSEGEQKKEAQAINSSLSALGDVISALASEQAHIPYRNHKLTMLMSDSLGGNAKTLMFVNVSPTDGNLDETVNSLQYATRVRTIKNNPMKEIATKEIAKLREQIRYWKEKAGKGGDGDLTEITDTRSTPANGP